MPTANWKRTGDQLVRRRIELDPRYANRRLFAAERGLNYRIITDLEHGRRGNYEPATLTAAEVAYDLTAGSIARTAAGGDLEPLPDAPAQLRPFPVAPPVTAGAEAREILANLVNRYPDDEVIQAFGAEPHRPAWALVQAILTRLERQGDEVPAREILTGLLATHPDDKAVRQLGRQRAKKASMVTAEILEWLSWEPPGMDDARNGTAG